METTRTGSFIRELLGIGCSSYPRRCTTIRSRRCHSTNLPIITIRHKPISLVTQLRSRLKSKLQTTCGLVKAGCDLESAGVVDRVAVFRYGLVGGFVSGAPTGFLTPGRWSYYYVAKLRAGGSSRGHMVTAGNARYRVTNESGAGGLSTIYAGCRMS